MVITHRGNARSFLFSRNGILMFTSPTKIILMVEERLGHPRIRDISLENSMTDYDYILKNSLYFKT